MTISNLWYRYCRPETGTDLPVVALMHGFSDAAYMISTTDLARIAQYGFFVVVPGMRGRDAASGSPDCSGREIFDIYDAVAHARAAFPTLANQTKAAIVGYSGGGGNALAAACKFPDFWTVVVSCFGISDYGVDATTGWYQQEVSYRATLESWVGGTPVAAPNNYAARNSRAGIVNYTGGQVHLFHDTEDGVNINQSQLLEDAMAAAGMTNVAEHYTTTTDNPRYLHGYPVSGTGIAETAEAIWKPDVLSGAAWTIAASGTVTVIGYIVTKRFTIWLNANGTATTGIDAAATVAYNTATDTYTVTPLTTGGLDVSITQGAKTGSAANITEATQIIVS